MVSVCLTTYWPSDRMLVLSDKILHKVGVHCSPVDFVFARVVTVGGRVLKLLITSRSRSFVAGSHLSPRCVYFLFGFRTCLHVWRSWFLSENSAFIPSPFSPFPKLSLPPSSVATTVSFLFSWEDLMIKKKCQTLITSLILHLISRHFKHKKVLCYFNCVKRKIKINHSWKVFLKTF